MAIPPGAREHRSLVVFNDKTKAEEVANSIEPLIVRMPLSDWHKRGKAYQALLSSLPEDDDGIIGTMSADTGEVSFVDKKTYEATCQILKRNQPFFDSDNVLPRLKEFFL